MVDADTRKKQRKLQALQKDMREPSSNHHALSHLLAFENLPFLLLLTTLPFRPGLWRIFEFRIVIQRR